MPTPHPDSDTPIDAYLSGELDPQIAEQLRARWDASPGQRGFLAGIRASIRGEPIAPTIGDVAADRDALFAKLDAVAEPTVGQESRFRKHSNTRPVGSRMLPAVFGGVALILASVGVTRWVTRSPEHIQRYQTTPGQRSTVRLADGSTMILAPATSATVSSKGVEITGEAYFSIAANASHPMLVRTKNAVVHVLGTTFAVRRYADERNTRVVVEQGKVSVEMRREGDSKPRRAILAARMLAHVSDSGVTVTPGIAPRDYTSWTHGTLVFNRVPLRDVAAELTRAYDVDITVTDTMLARRSVIAEVEVNKRTVTQILDAICLSVDAHYERQGSLFLLSPGIQEGRSPNRQNQHNRDPQPEKQYGR